MNDVSSVEPKWFETVKVTLGKDVLTFDNCHYVLYPNGIIQVTTEIKEKEGNTFLFKKRTSFLKFSDVSRVDLYESTGVVEVIEQEDNVLELKRD